MLVNRLKYFLAVLVIIWLASEPTAGQSANNSQKKQTATSNEPEKGSSVLAGQESDSFDAAQGVSFTNPVKNRWRVGVKIRGRQRPANNFFITIPVPTNWPEQTVELYREDIPPEVSSVNYRELNSGVRQLVLQIPQINANQLVEVAVTFTVTTHQVLGPPHTESFEIPRRVDRKIREYLGVSPQINYRNSKMRKLTRELTSENETAWEKVETLFDWVRDNIERVDKEPTKIDNVIRNSNGCGEDLVKLFVGMCRSIKVPARMVWVEGAQYAEFYLVDKAGNGHWFPCDVAGRREFGSIAEPRIIQQKGDSIKVPEKDKRQKFCAEFVYAKGKAKPAVVFIRDLLPAN